jgi:hypothetical protein
VIIPSTPGHTAHDEKTDRRTLKMERRNRILSKSAQKLAQMLATSLDDAERQARRPIQFKD